MERLIAYCGLDCAQCPGRIATVTNDDALRAKTAAAWKESFGFPLGPEAINCLGCKGEGAKIGHCSECGMRLCAIGRGVRDCGACAEYSSCAKIQEFTAQVPEAKANLESA